MIRKDRVKVRIASLNVDGFYHNNNPAFKKGEDFDRVEDIYKIIASLDIDIICLQEVAEPRAASLCKKLGFPNFSYAAADYLGNAIISRFKIEKEFQVLLDYKESEKEEDGNYDELRSASIATIETSPTTKILIAATHLDHRREETRLKQFNFLHNYLQKMSESYFVLGDFNSVKRSDYSEENWEKNNTNRMNYRLSPARDDVVTQIERLGYIDACTFKHGADLPSSLSALSSAYALSPVSTSTYGTRVDYIWKFASSSISSPSSFLNDWNFNHASYNAVDVVSTGFTDHNLIHVDVIIKTESEK